MNTSPNSTSTASDTASQRRGEGSPSAQSAELLKRKRENRYNNAPPAVPSRRRAQNRASQRAYRERKEQRIRDLEVLLEEAQRKWDNLSRAYQALKAEYEKLSAKQRVDGGGSQLALPLHYAIPPLPCDPYSSRPPLGIGFAPTGYGSKDPVTTASISDAAGVAASDMMGGLVYYVSA